MTALALGNPTPCRCGHVALWHAAVLSAGVASRYPKLHHYYGRCEFAACPCPSFEPRRVEVQPEAVVAA